MNARETKLFPVYHGNVRVGTVRAATREEAYGLAWAKYPQHPADHLRLFPYDLTSDGYLPPAPAPRSPEYSI